MLREPARGWCGKRLPARYRHFKVFSRFSKAALLSPSESRWKMRAHSASSAALAVAGSGFCTLGGLAARCVRGSTCSAGVSAVGERRAGRGAALSETCSLGGEVAAGMGFAASVTMGGEGSTGAIAGIAGR